MPQDPSSQFDETVLDLIEHSPVGAVPHTPSYQDSLRRLYASHQAYPSADFKEGHATARSLARLPSFCAANIEVLGSEHTETLEPNSAIFDRYIKSLPSTFQARAESLRSAVAGRPALHRAKHGATTAHDPIHSLFLVPGAGPHHGLPGNYVYGFVAEGAAHKSWSLHLHDAADGAVHYNATSVQDALEKLQEVLASAPFHLSEIEMLGFKFV